MKEVQTWKKKLTEAMKRYGDAWENIIYVHLSEVDRGETEWYDVELDGGGVSFIVWTAVCVYFPIIYDGAEWAEGVPRYPTNGVEASHFGGC